ncbi:BON domain-containing protein [Sphaerotilus uruguayifluvii]|uniref:Osmotically-inducible protein OsmY n=1 Tax=Sphaerotilus uruguayifluvii TaxID=2735897 RepID=A0ABX2FWH4_9BURK|nr:BON domain-containing protein [Leptothrix sp. C29]NRT54371.1 osmotically-inducible protein OsmY [Leptothrix sp. C29]
MNTTALLKTLSAIALTSALALPAAHAAHAAPSADEAALAGRVQTALLQDSHLVKPEITVEVQPGGRVHLTGWVHNTDDINEAMLAAKQVAGVSSVTAFLRSWTTND